MWGVKVFVHSLPILKTKDVGHCETVETRSQVPDHQLRPLARVVFCPTSLFHNIGKLDTRH